MQEQRKTMRSKKPRISLWHRDLRQRRMRKKCGTGQAGNLTDTRSIRFQTKARKPCRTQRFRWQTQRHPSVILRLAFPAAPTEKCFTAQERAAVYNKTEDHCAICGEFVPYTDFTVDHIIPLAKGGNNDLSNLQCACSVCNRIKQDILPEDLMKKLTRIMVYQVGQKGNKKYKKILRKACR